MMSRLALLGSTGSIGTSALDVVRHHPERLELATLAAQGSNLEMLEAQIGEFEPAMVAVFDPEKATALADRVGERTQVVAGPEGLVAASTHPEVDLLLAAVVGAAGLPAVHAALSAGKDVALANKESLVVAGGLLTRLAHRTGARILPVMSALRRLSTTVSGITGRLPSKKVFPAMVPLAQLT